MYNFDKPVDRRGTGAYKYERMDRVFGRKDLQPMWVADMEFETPDFIVDALRKRLEHHIFGYPITPDDFAPAIKKWEKDRHGWEIEEEWIDFVPGIVKGIGMAVRAMLKPGEKVVIQPPVYHPFRLVPQDCGYEVVFNPMLQNEDGSYRMDLEGLDKLLENDKLCKMLILCNPHNPAGIVWDRETLKALALICHKHGVLVISDEIHCDMALFGHKHIPFASVCKEAEQGSITFAAPSKTFNIAGIVSSHAIVPNKDIRDKFFGWMEACEMNDPGIFPPIATIAAFTKGESWRQELIKYLENNVLAVEEFCRERLPEIKPLRPQASFLIWLDCRGLGLSHKELVNLFVEEARLGLNDGAMFGKEGTGYMRFNIGASRTFVLEALEKLEKAVIKCCRK
ncbi:MAG: PatB family C-S lyase [Bacteroidales bacterium]|nr:PatB family C-S lyase [Bacteroidales bacterium]